MENVRRKIIAAGGLTAFAAGFSQTAYRMWDKVLGKDAPPSRFYGDAPAPEFKVDTLTGELALNPDQQVSYTGCLGCTTQCGVRVRIDKRTGKVLRVSGNPTTRCPQTPNCRKAYRCARASSPFRASATKASTVAPPPAGGATR